MRRKNPRETHRETHTTVAQFYLAFKSLFSMWCFFWVISYAKFFQTHSFFVLIILLKLLKAVGKAVKREGTTAIAIS